MTIERQENESPTNEAEGQVVTFTYDYEGRVVAREATIHFAAPGPLLEECDTPLILDAQGNVLSPDSDLAGQGPVERASYTWTGRELEVDTSMVHKRVGKCCDHGQGRLLDDGK